MTTVHNKRVAVIVDNVCLRDTRVIKSAEAMAAEGYEVRVFCRDKRKNIGYEYKNGVSYQRNWMGSLYYSQNLGDQRLYIGTYLFQIPGRLTSKLNFCATLYLLTIAYLLKDAIDAVRQKRKLWAQDRNKSGKKLATQQSREVLKLRRSKKRFAKPKEYLVRARYKSRREWHRRGRPIAIVFVLIFLGIILFIPGLIFGLSVLIALGWFSINRMVQKIGQPELNVAQKKAIENTVVGKPVKQKRLHTRLLDLLLSDKTDEVYVNRVVKFRAARIYHSTREAIIAFKPDLIHAHDLVNLPVGYLLKKDTNAKLIYDAHELETARDKPSHKRWKTEIRKLEGYFAKKANAVITVSDGLANEISRVHKVAKPTVILNTPDNSGAEPVAINIREELGLSTETPIALYVGGLKITRGLPFFLEAAAMIPDLQLVACGPRTAKAESDFNKLSERLNVSDRFHMVGPIDPKYLLDYIKPSDLSIMPTQNIGLSYIHALPNKFFESMFSGIPIVVGADIVEMATIVEKNNLGRLVKQNDPEDIAKVMREIINKKDKSKLEYAKDELVSIYGWQAQIKKLSNLYKSQLI